MINKKLVVIIFVTLIVSVFVYLFLFYLTVIDTKNVNLSGYILDEETNLPIENVLVIVNNERYENDEGYKTYDEYLGKDKMELYSDSKGYYSTIIEKSAFVVLSFEKEGYIRKKEKGKYSRKQMKYKTYLKKE